MVIEIFGIPTDCAEERTRTIRNDSYNPIFEESFEFHVTFPELALCRFMVLDDEMIGTFFFCFFVFFAYQYENMILYFKFFVAISSPNGFFLDLFSKLSYSCFRLIYFIKKRIFIIKVEFIRIFEQN